MFEQFYLKWGKTVEIFGLSRNLTPWILLNKYLDFISVFIQQYSPSANNCLVIIILIFISISLLFKPDPNRRQNPYFMLGKLLPEKRTHNF